nr:unnamed protein product [Callosobruchus analis]
MDLANDLKKLEEHFTKSMDAFNGRLKQAVNADKPESEIIYYETSSSKCEISSRKSPSIERSHFRPARGEIGCLYKPPSANSFDFIDELETVIGNLVTMTDEIVFMGDLNIDMLNTQSRYTAMLNKLLDSVGLSQFITQPTRITITTQTLIDLICISNSGAVISSGVTSVNAISDHELVCCTLSTNNQSTPVVHSYRDYRNLNINYLTSEFKSLPWRVLYDLEGVGEKTEFFNCAVLALQNRHAPIITRSFSKSYKPWMTDNLKFFISLRNKALAKFKKSRYATDFECYKQLKKYIVSAIRQERKAFMEKQIKRDKNNVWNNLRIMSLGEQKDNISIPVSLSNVADINEYYIKTVPRNDDDFSQLIEEYEAKAASLKMSVKFEKTDEITVLKHVASIKSNSIGFDGIEIKLLIPCCPFLLPYLTHIINYCLRDFMYPSNWKIAKIIPVPKNKDPQTFKDLRPISILSAPSKILEKILNGQLRSCLLSYAILPDDQAGFRAGHSCCAAKQSKAKQSKAKQSKAKQSKAKQSKAKQSKAKQSKAKQSKAKQSKAKQSKAKQSKAKQSKAKQSKEKQSKAKQSKAKQSKAKQSKAKQSKAKQSKAKQSKAKQSKAKQSKSKQSKAKQSKAKQSKAKQSKAK